jgi:hypothetical protein
MLYDLGAPILHQRNLGDTHQWATSHLDMDEAFCARMRMAIAAGLESAPIGVVTTPGTKKPKYFPAERYARSF